MKLQFKTAKGESLFKAINNKRWMRLQKQLAESDIDWTTKETLDASRKVAEVKLLKAINLDVEINDETTKHLAHLVWILQVSKNATSNYCWGAKGDGRNQSDWAEKKRDIRCKLSSILDSIV